MSVASQKIIYLVLPIPSTGEIYGLPKEATSLGDEPDVLIVEKEHPDWDFKPWFMEKSGALKDAINKLMKNLETNPDDILFPSSANIIPQQFIADMIRMDMAEIEYKANAIQSMIESGRLSVTDVKLEGVEEE